MIKKKEKLHEQMFRTDGFPDNSSFLERGLHINSKGLNVLLKKPEVFTREQESYIRLHLKECAECADRFNGIEGEEEQMDLPIK